MQSETDLSERLAAKVDQLIQRHRQALERMESLDRENKLLKERLISSEQRVEQMQLERRREALLGRDEAAVKERSELKETIRALVGEVDACIALLNERNV